MSRTRRTAPLRSRLSLERLEGRALLTALPTATVPDLTDASDLGILANDNLTSDSTPTLVGQAAQGATSVAVLNGSVELGRAPVVNGSWEFTPSTPLADGRYRLTVRPFGEGDVAGRPSRPLTIVIDTAVPAAPSVGLNSLSDTGVKGDGISNLGRPTLTGVGPRGGSVRVAIDGVDAGLARMLPTGRWTLTPSADIGDGVKPVTIVATSRSGVEAPPVSSTITVDRSPLEATIAVSDFYSVAVVTFNKPVISLPLANLRLFGTMTGVGRFSFPLTNRAALGAVSRPVASEGGRVWTISAIDVPIRAGTFTLEVVPTRAVTDTAGNLLSAQTRWTETFAG